MSFVPSDFFPAYLDFGERVLTRQENQIYNAVGGLNGVLQMQLAQSQGAAICFPEDLVDYKRLGDATVEAFDRAGIRVFVNSRELGRLMKEGDRL